MLRRVDNRGRGRKEEEEESRRKWRKEQADQGMDKKKGRNIRRRNP